VARTFRPALAPDERVLLYEQGGYTSGRSWRLGILCLTDRRLLFAQGDRQRADIPLSSVRELGIERRPFALATKPCLTVRHREGGGNGLKAWLTVAHIETWWKVMTGLVEEQGTSLHAEGGQPWDVASRTQPVSSHGQDDPRAAGPALRLTRRESADIEMGRQRALQIVSEARNGPRHEPFPTDGIAEVTRLLDRASRRLVWHIWKNQHARLDELTALLGETSHMNVLVRIRETINPLAVRLLGRPLLVFERSRVDQRTGQQILFSWWLNEEPPGEPADQSEFVDVLDEGDYFLVLLELPGINGEEIKLSAGGGTLTVTVDTTQRRYHEQVTLPAAVDGDHPSTSYRNGVLQVRLNKESTP
jgi:HSP20 family molecular chaperone IbpA